MQLKFPVHFPQAPSSLNSNRIHIPSSFPPGPSDSSLIWKLPSYQPGAFDYDFEFQADFPQSPSALNSNQVRMHNSFPQAPSNLDYRCIPLRPSILNANPNSLPPSALELEFKCEFQIDFHQAHSNYASHLNYHFISPRRPRIWMQLKFPVHSPRAPSRLNLNKIQIPSSFLLGAIIIWIWFEFPIHLN